jgi:feruloyl esterase
MIINDYNERTAMTAKCLLGAVGLLYGAAALAQPAVAPAAALSAADCQIAKLAPALAGLDLGKTVTLESAQWAAGGSERAGNASVAVPPHCVVSGTIGAHRGAPGATAYGNHFRLRIPSGWRGRFVFQGGGGNNGVVGNALGLLKNGASALAQGYAVVAQDSGHEGRDARFALDRQAYLDFAYEGVHDVSRVSKALLQAIAGRVPDYSYFVGCSNGGREALVTAQRYADFDGVVAGAPGFAVYDQWQQNMAVLKAVARAAGVAPGVAPADTSRAFTDAQLDYAGGYFMDKCDRLDGIRDGLISNYQACTAKPADYAALQCKAGGGDSTDARCLNAVQADVLREIHTGLVDRNGKLVFPGLLPGGIERALREPYLGTPGASVPLGSFYATIMPNFWYMGYGFRGYPALTGPADQAASYPQSGAEWVAGFDPFRDGSALAQGRLDFHGSNTDPRLPGPNFEAFHRRGGKLLMYVGSADHGVQARGVMGLMDRIKAQYDGAADMARLYVVPGMSHCRGGATVDQFDELAPLAAWVERGVAPQALVARAVPGSALDPKGEGVSRPLCAYPAYARYQGGDPQAAASYACSVD